VRFAVSRKEKIMNGLYTIILLILSNVFMTLAWYGHLKLQENGVSNHWPLIGVIVFSWGIAFFEDNARLLPTRTTRL
jgi:uncharacterized protein (DUF486 family)